jgi:hypothetical protein
MSDLVGDTSRHLRGLSLEAVSRARFERCFSGGRFVAARAAFPVTLVVALAVARAGSARTPATAGTAHYYLALGDSLAQGMQPDSAGITRNTNEG